MQASPPPRRRSGAGWKIAAVLFGLMLAVSLLINFVTVLLSGGSPGHSAHGSGLLEVVVEDNGARDKVAVLSLEGVISGQAYGAGGYSLVSSIKDQLDNCADDDRIKAVIVKVDSPGGEVLASDDIARLIEDFQKETGKPVVSSMGSMAASGGYYVSAPCQWIVANELTMTGSIGVIMSGYNLRGLMDKLGVRPMVFKSGKLKDMLSMGKKPEEITDEERDIVQGIISSTFDRFKEVVNEGRKFSANANAGAGRRLDDTWEDFADGRLLTGKQAFDLGMVDELGNFDTAFERAQKLAGISNANLIAFQEPFRLGSIFRLLGESEANTVKIDLGLNIPQLQAGKLYFLPPHLIQ
jgi:protease-4